MASTIPAPARGDLGDAGRIQNEGKGYAPPVLQEFEKDIRQLFRDFFQNSATQSSDREAALAAIPSSNPLGYKGYYSRSLALILQGSCEALSNLGGSSKSRAGFVSFPISLIDIAAYSDTLSNWVQNYPTETLIYFDAELRAIVDQDILPRLGLTQPSCSGFRVTFHDSQRVVSLRELEPCDLETLVAVRGVCIRVSSVIPEMQTAVFRCTGKSSKGLQYAQCNKEVSEIVVNGQVNEPIFCDKCQGRRTFILAHDACVFTSKQLMKIQETPDSVPEGETHQTLFVYLYDEMVDSGKPGDLLCLTGIFRAVPVKKSARVTNLKTVFRTCLEVLNVSREGGIEVVEETIPENLESYLDYNRCYFDPVFVSKARALAENPNCYEILAENFAPNIWEHTDVKKGLLCQLFGGTSQWTGEGSEKRLRSRGEIHILLCGDPSTAKSQFLQYVHSLAPRGVYAVGRGSSAAGLTASITRDTETKDFVLESGAVVLSDRGVCCIDEFDKMDDSTRSILHEVMEQQTVSLAKAGIVCSLNARTALLASANPLKSRYDVRRSVVENLRMPPTLLSRFDLIFLILDVQNENLDRRLAEHLTNLYTLQPEAVYAQCSSKETFITQSFLAQYISYARKTCSPQLSAAANEELVATYVALRGTDARGSVSATPRQLDSLIRLSKALAKMRLQPVVAPTDVKEAARLIRTATYQALTDPTTGRIDFEQLHAGASEASRFRQTFLGDTLLNFLSSLNGVAGGKGEIQAHIEQRLREEGKPPLGKRELERALVHFEAIGIVARVHADKYIPIRTLEENN